MIHSKIPQSDDKNGMKAAFDRAVVDWREKRGCPSHAERQKALTGSLRIKRRGEIWWHENVTRCPLCAVERARIPEPPPYHFSIPQIITAVTIVVSLGVLVMHLIPDRGPRHDNLVGNQPSLQSSPATVESNQLQVANSAPNHAIPGSASTTDPLGFAESLIASGNTAYMQGKNAEAVALYREAISIFEKLSGSSNSNVVVSLNNLAVVLKNVGKHPEAEPSLREALAIAQNLLTGGHPAPAPDRQQPVNSPKTPHATNPVMLASVPPPEPYEPVLGPSAIPAFEIRKPKFDELGRFWIYKNIKEPSLLPLFPSGFMPTDAGKMLTVETDCRQNPHLFPGNPEGDETCIAVTARWAMRDWCGVAFLPYYGSLNTPWWGDDATKGWAFDLSALKKKRLVFFARSESDAPARIQVQFGILGDKRFGEKLTTSVAAHFDLSSTWTRCELEFNALKLEELSRISSMAIILEKREQRGASVTRIWLDSVFME